MTNEDRAKSVAIQVQTFAKAADLVEADEGPETLAADMIANLLHWVVSRENGGAYSGALMAMRKGIAHFVNESYDEEDAGPMSKVSISVYVGEDVWTTQTGEKLPELPEQFGGKF